MGKLLTLLIAFIAVASLSSQSQRVHDLAVFNVLKQGDRSLMETTVWRRVPVTDTLDLVLAMATPKSWPFGTGDGYSMSWGDARTLGVFLQNRSEPGQLFLLTRETALPECGARILRATATDIVISCQGEKSERYEHRKFVYDVRAKRLVGHFSYDAFQMHRASTRRGGALIVGTDGTRRVDVDFMPGRIPEFRVAGLTAKRPDIQISQRTLVAPRFGPSSAFRFVGGEVVETRGGRDRKHRLPISTYEAFRKARPERVQNGYDRESTSFAEEVGPWQLDGDTFWFGKTFYDGEGVSGVGGFGYFDVIERKYRLLTSPTIVHASVSAIHVEPGSVWLALVQRGEWGDANVGVVRFDRQSEAFREFRTAGIGREFVPVGDQLLLATDAGISVFRDNFVKEYLVDRTTDGRLRIVALDH
jgi:hypothetical protein